MEYLDHDQICDLWKNDPEAAEAYHRAVIEDYIEGLPEEKKPRARALQWRIDQEVSRIKNPQVRLERVFGMMWDSFLDLNNALNYPASRKSARPKADVLEFKVEK